MDFPSLKEIFVGAIITFFAIQIVSILLTAIFGIPTLRGGTAILLLLVLIAIIALYNISFDLQKFGKEQIIFVVIVFGIIALGFWKGPEYFPNLFSLTPLSDSIKQAIASIVG